MDKIIPNGIFIKTLIPDMPKKSVFHVKNKNKLNVGTLFAYYKIIEGNYAFLGIRYIVYR